MLAAALATGAVFEMSDSTRPRGATLAENSFTAKAIDLDRYAGEWFQIVEATGDNSALFAIANGVSKPCYGVRVRYVVDDGALRLTNSCNEGGFDGRLIEISGVARPTDPRNSRLKVRFDPWYLRPFTFDYWIIHVDPDYTLAILASPQSKGVTILSRTPRISPGEMAQARQVASVLGYDFTKTRLTPQRD
jgi:apolipoprotein D and lipocalin family protein